MKRLFIGLMVAATAAIGFGGVSAFADPSANWQLASGSVKTASDGSNTFNFSVPDKTRLLYNSKDATLLGPQLGSTMIATFTVSGVTGTFTYGGEPSCGGTTGNVRLAFESIPPGSKFAYTNYWWADASYVLANTDGAVTLTMVVDSAQAWSDWNGQPSSGLPAEFNAAAGNMTEVGLSFGGGCFFENGVGTTDGSGSFTLTNFTS
jgi:hypothetical protein